MTRKIKTLGLALVAALALTGVTASAAQANFTSSAAHTTLYGEQGEFHRFNAGAGVGVINCTINAVHGTSAGTSTATITVKPTIAGCKDSLSRTVHVNNNTLEYHFLSTTAKGKLTLTGHVEFIITSEFGMCIITFEGDQTLNGLTYTQQGNDLLIRTHTTNITSTIHGGGFVCGTLATHSSTGTYEGTTLLEGNGGTAKVSVH